MIELGDLKPGETITIVFDLPNMKFINDESI
jgi:hypothetical protein